MVTLLICSWCEPLFTLHCCYYFTQAIIDLYDLKENRPDIDLAGCLSTGSEGFQKYVKKGLRLVKEMRETGRGRFHGIVYIIIMRGVCSSSGVVWF